MGLGEARLLGICFGPLYKGLEPCPPLWNLASEEQCKVLAL